MTILGARSPIGVGWRTGLALAIDRYPGLGFVEVIAEDFDPQRAIPEPIAVLRDRGIPAIPHGIGLSLGGAERPERRRLEHLARLATQLASPLVSEHVAFVRAGEREAGHLLPVSRTREYLEILVENVREAVDALPVPLALENIATLFDWPDDAIPEGEFLAELLDRSGAYLLLDLANVHANARNRGRNPHEELARLPIDRLAYAHVAGGLERDGIYHDTHTATTPAGVLDLVADLAGEVAVPGILLERDDGFPQEAELHDELDAILAAIRRGAAIRQPDRAHR